MNLQHEVALPLLTRRAVIYHDHTRVTRKVILSGWERRVVHLLMFLQLLWVSLARYRRPGLAIRLAIKVYNRRLEYRTNQPKIARMGNRYFMNLNTPGWPSKAFNRYLLHLLRQYAPGPGTSLFTLVFAITNKCGFRCEHCVEWERLNKKDNLSKEEALAIIQRFHRIGVSQVQLSGGEPLNRMEDIIYLLDHAPKGIDFWIYSNGYQLSAARAARLKKHGLTGVIISLDHHDPEKHDQFRGTRGSYRRLMESARHAVNHDLSLAFSCCATNDFVSMNNLLTYARICRAAGASFIQLMEPEAVGHYAGKKVCLEPAKQQLLENFFYLMNFDKAYKEYPVVSYPAMIKRHNGCPGAGAHFVYVDAEGDLHTCPFCQKKVCKANDPELESKIRLMKEGACSLKQWDVASRLNGRENAISTRSMPAESLSNTGSILPLQN